MNLVNTDYICLPGNFITAFRWRVINWGTKAQINQCQQNVITEGGLPGTDDNTAGRIGYFAFGYRGASHIYFDERLIINYALGQFTCPVAAGADAIRIWLYPTVQCAFVVDQQSIYLQTLAKALNAAAPYLLRSGSTIIKPVPKALPPPP
jgi:hypothetical protein